MIPEGACVTLLSKGGSWRIRHACTSNSSSLFVIGVSAFLLIRNVFLEPPSNRICTSRAYLATILKCGAQQPGALAFEDCASVRAYTQVVYRACVSALHVAYLETGVLKVGGLVRKAHAPSARQSKEGEVETPSEQISQVEAAGWRRPGLTWVRNRTGGARRIGEQMIGRALGEPVTAGVHRAWVASSADRASPHCLRGKNSALSLLTTPLNSRKGSRTCWM